MLLDEETFFQNKEVIVNEVLEKLRKFQLFAANDPVLQLRSTTRIKVTNYYFHFT